MPVPDGRARDLSLPPLAPTCLRCYPARHVTDDQYRSLIIHIRAVIVLLGIIAGILLAIAWAYLALPE